MKRLALAIVCGYFPVSFCMDDVPKFGSGIENIELRELVQTWESLKANSEKFDPKNKMVLGEALKLLDGFCGELRGYITSTDHSVNYQPIDLVMSGLSSVYRALEEVKKEAEEEERIREKIKGLAVIDDDDFVDEF
jgi:hypothetical protein